MKVQRDNDIIIFFSFIQTANNSITTPMLSWLWSNSDMESVTRGKNEARQLVQKWLEARGEGAPFSEKAGVIE